MAKTPHRLLLDKKLGEVFSNMPKGKVLDAGGWGSPHKKIIPHTVYVCLDLDKTKNPDIVGDIHNLPMKNSVYDGVVCTEVFEHVANPFKAVGELHRVLKVGGWFVVSVPFLYPYHGDHFSKDFWRYSKDGARELFKEFKEVNIIPIGGLFSTIFVLLSNRFPKLNHLSFLVLFEFFPAFCSGFIIYGKK